MLLRIVSLIFPLVILPAVYIFFCYSKSWTQKLSLRLLTFMPSVLLLAYFFVVFRTDDMMAAHQARVGTFAILFFAVTAPAMLFTILDVLGCWTHGVVRRVVRIVALTVALTAFLILGFGYVEGRHHYRVHEQTFTFSNLPKEFDGYRIAQFSDLHIGTFADGHREDVSKIVRLINAQRCNAILFCGDLVNFESHELDGYDSLLSSLHTPDGVFAVTGNHDYPTYIRRRDFDRKADMARLRRLERSFGWKLLLNENVVLHRGKDSLALIGVENDGNPPFPSLGDLPKATEGLKNVMRVKKEKSVGQEDHTFSVLMSHDPTHWHRRVVPDTRIDLTLSGHTHAAQFKVFGWSPVEYVYKEWSGSYTDGAQLLNVSEGIGQILFPFRFGAWPEVNIITLRRRV